MIYPNRLRSLVFLLAFAPTSDAADEIPGAPQTKPIAIVNAMVHTASGAPIERGSVLFADGKITAIGKSIDVPDDAQQIDGTGKHVYPGLFDAYTQLGLVEIAAVRATRDSRETGTINPNVEAHKAVNPDSELIPVARSNGVLLALTAPVGGRISGQSSVIQLDGWTWEDLTLAPRVAMHVSWPRVQSIRTLFQADVDEQVERRSKLIQRLGQVIEDARAYHKARSTDAQHPHDTRWEAMEALLAGRQPLVVEVDELQAIQEVVSFAQRHKLRLIILGGYDAELAAPLLKKHEIPVIIAAVYRLPQRRSDPFDAAYTLPDRLRRAGVKYCIAGADSAPNARNLPYHAATAAAYGLPHSEAIRAITLYPAQILGIADRVGSLEVAKDATLLIADGDILETPTQVEQAFVQGRKVDLNDRHKRLYRKYGQRLK